MSAPLDDFDAPTETAGRPQYKMRAADGRWLIPTPTHAHAGRVQTLSQGLDWLDGVEAVGRGLLAVPDGAGTISYARTSPAPITGYSRREGVPSVLGDHLTVEQYRAAAEHDDGLLDGAYVADRGPGVREVVTVPLPHYRVVDLAAAGDGPDLHDDWAYETRVDYSVFGTQLGHLLPGVVTGVRKAASEALGELSGFTTHPSLVNRSTPVEAYVVMSYDDHRTHLVPRGGRSKRKDPVRTTVTHKLAWTVPDTVAGESKAAAVAAAEALIAGIVDDARGIGMVVCGHCSGQGVVLSPQLADSRAVRVTA